VLSTRKLVLRRILVRRPHVCSLCCGFRKRERLRTLALCTRYTDASHDIRSQVAYCKISSNKLYSGVCGAGGETGCNFDATPSSVWGKEGDSSHVSKHYRCYLYPTWGCGGYWSGQPFSVRCVVALERQIHLRTLALCANTGSSSAIRSQVAFCGNSSNVLYSGVCGAGGETGCEFKTAPDAVWAKEANGTSKHHRGYLTDKWYTTYNWSGHLFSVRCVVVLEVIIDIVSLEWLYLRIQADKEFLTRQGNSRIFFGSRR